MKKIIIGTKDHLFFFSVQSENAVFLTQKFKEAYDYKSLECAKKEIEGLQKYERVLDESTDDYLNIKTRDLTILQATVNVEIKELEWQNK